MFADVQGGRIPLTEIQDKLDQELGGGAGDRFRLSCRNVTGHGSLAYELHLSLPPVTELRAAGKTLPLRDLMLNAPTLGPGCRHASVP